MKKSKKILALLMCAMMVCSGLPGTAFADTIEDQNVLSYEETSNNENTQEDITDLNNTQNSENSVESEATEESEYEEETTVETSAEQESTESDIAVYSVAEGDVAKIGDNGYATLAEAITAANAGDTIYLLQDVALTSKVTVSKNITLAAEDGKAVTISKDSNFKTTMFTVSSTGALTLSGNLTLVGHQSATGDIISVSGSLIINDGVTLKDNIESNASYGGAITVSGNGTVVMNGGTITNCKNTKNANSAATFSGGGAVRIVGSANKTASFTMNSGIISGCEAEGPGGAIAMSAVKNSKVFFVMNGGTISNCESKGYGGAIYMYNVKTNAVANCLFEMKGGLITGNKSAQYGTLGYNASAPGSYKLMGGTIQNNSTGAAGQQGKPGKGEAGIINSTKDGIFVIGGNAQISDEICINQMNSKITISNNFTGSVKVYIPYNATEGYEFAKIVDVNGNATTDTSAMSGKITLTNTESDGNGNYVLKFKSVDTKKGTLAAGKYTEDVQQYTVTYTDGVDGTVFADKTETVNEGEATPAFGSTPSREGYDFAGWTPEIAAKVTENVTYTATWTPKKPDAAGSNVVENLVKVICDTDSNHAAINANWRYNSGKTIGTVTWNAELNTWTVEVRLDSIGVQYVPLMEKANNKISHERAANQANFIDFTLKWDASANKWVTLDGESLEIHTVCSTKPEAPKVNGTFVYQIKVQDNAGEVTDKFYDVPANISQMSEVYGSRSEGYKLDVTVSVTDNDEFITDWMKDNKVDGYMYDWSKTPDTVTFTLCYIGDLTGTLYGSNINDWKLPNGSNIGTVGTLYVGKKTDVTYSDGVNGTIFTDKTYTVAQGDATPDFGATPSRDGYDFAGWTPEVAATVTENVTYTAIWTPKKPDAVGNNVAENLVKVICDTDSDHDVVNANWRYGSGKTIGTVTWNETLNTWTVEVRLDSIGVQYVPLMESANNKIHHERAAEQANFIDFTLKWDASANKWVTLDGKSLEIHTVCSTKPEDPKVNDRFTYQIKVQDNAAEVTDKFYGVPVSVSKISEVYGSRSEGFKLDVTVSITDNDEFITAWMKDNKVDGYMYDWSKTPDTVTFTLCYTGDLTGTLYGSNINDWKLANGSNIGTVGTLYVGKKTDVTYNDGANGTVFADQTYTVAQGEATPAFNGTTERTGYVFAGWTPEVTQTAEQTVTYTATWTANQYKVTFDANGGTVDRTEQTVSYESAVGELPTPTRTGYTFAGWYTENGEEVTASTIYTLADDSTYTAKWTANTYKITFDTDGGKTDKTTQDVTYDGTVGKLPTPTRTGYTFAGWYTKDGQKITENSIYTIASDVTLVAKWTKDASKDNSGKKTNTTTGVKTGDNTPLGIVFAVMLISVCIASVLLVFKRRKHC